MRQFFKFLFASCLGFMLALVAIGGIFMIIGIGAAGSQSKSTKLKPNTVLELSFDQPVPELTNNVERDPFNLEQEDVLGLRDVVRAIEHAKDDKNIKGILLKPEMSGQGMATQSVLRQALDDFRSSGKFIIAYAQDYSQGSYYLASTAEKIYLHPMGSFDFRGFAAVIPFFKDMLDKVGVKFQVFYAGDFKSATEPFRRTNMSDENRLQLREYLDEMYSLYLGDVSKSRKSTAMMMDSIADNLLLKNAKAALDFGLVDGLVYRDEVMDDIKKRLGLEEKDKILTVNLNKYFSSIKFKEDFSVKDKVAVVYAEGDIVDGESKDGEIGDKNYTKLIERLAKDEKIKAIVLRVNSPGGSGMSSENIWRQLTLAREKGKKIVVSMGDYAASGGYYISCAADSVMAEKETLTGSIGVFGMFPEVSQLMNNKLGIHFDTVKTGPHAAGFNPALGLSDAEGAYLQSSVNDFYEHFLKRVADARGMSRDDVHKVAQGRIWSGRKAVELGLVDRIGNLDDAVVSAAKLAGLEKYRIVQYPKPKDPITQIMDKIMGNKDDQATRLLQKELGEWGLTYKMLKQLKNNKSPQARLPVVVSLH